MKENIERPAGGFAKVYYGLLANYGIYKQN